MPKTAMKMSVRHSGVSAPTVISRPMPMTMSTEPTTGKIL